MSHLLRVRNAPSFLRLEPDFDQPGFPSAFSVKPLQSRIDRQVCAIEIDCDLVGRLSNVQQLIVFSGRPTSRRGFRPIPFAEARH
jgi:hypothetical protein